jgi:hypothetical protein
MQRSEASWKTINIQQITFRGPNENLLMLIKNNYGENSLKVKMKVRDVQGLLST